jgi:hypothetical protein
VTGGQIKALWAGATSFWPGSGHVKVAAARMLSFLCYRVSLVFQWHALKTWRPGAVSQAATMFRNRARS